MSRLIRNQKYNYYDFYHNNFKFMNNINRDQFGDCFPSNLVRLKLFGELHGRTCLSPVWYRRAVRHPETELLKQNRLITAIL